MTGERSDQHDALGAYLEQAAHDLARSNETLGDDAEGLLFLWAHAIKAIPPFSRYGRLSAGLGS